MCPLLKAEPWCVHRLFNDLKLVVDHHVELSDVGAGVHHQVDVVDQLLLLGVVVARSTAQSLGHLAGLSDHFLANIACKQDEDVYSC